MKKYIALSFIVSLLGACAVQQTPFAGGSGSFKKLVWQDEFNGTGLPDASRWDYEQGYVRNRELQYYTVARSQNARIENGNLVITALHDSLKTDKGLFPVTSASLHTRGRQSWTYGRIEVRAKVPSSLGTWPAIWTLGTNIGAVGWPACGEIDIMEHVGYMPDTVHFNAHTSKYNHVKGIGKGTRIFVKEPHQTFHVYAIEWFPERIDWYFDDRKVFTFANEQSGKDAWPFSEPQYLILNLAFGGAWGATRGVDTGSLPQQFFIDYVRVYQ